MVTTLKADMIRKAVQEALFDGESVSALVVSSVSGTRQHILKKYRGIISNRHMLILNNGSRIIIVHPDFIEPVRGFRLDHVTIDHEVDLPDTTRDVLMAQMV